MRRRDGNAQLPSLIVLIALKINLASCAQEQPGYTEKERVCIVQHDKNYDPKLLSQCVGPGKLT
jgi:hypothetical protein